MKWDEVRDRLAAAGLKTSEEIYMENYGKVLASERPEFRGRYFRCTYGVLLYEGVRIQVFIFPAEDQLQDFLEVIGDDPWYVPSGNAVLHFPECDPAIIDSILAALSTTSQ